MLDPEKSRRCKIRVLNMHPHACPSARLPAPRPAMRKRSEHIGLMTRPAPSAITGGPSIRPARPLGFNRLTSCRYHDVFLRESLLWALSVRWWTKLRRGSQVGQSPPSTGGKGPFLTYCVDRAPPMPHGLDISPLGPLRIRLWSRPVARVIRLDSWLHKQSSPALDDPKSLPR